MALGLAWLIFSAESRRGENTAKSALTLVVAGSGLVAFVAGNVTSETVPRNPPPGLAVEVDWGGEWVDGEVIRAHPRGRVEVRVTLQRGRVTSIVSQEQLRYGFDALWTMPSRWQLAHYTLVSHVLLGLGLGAYYFFGFDQAFARLAAQRRRRQLGLDEDDAESLATEESEEPHGLQVGLLRLAFDAARRAAVQDELRRIALTHADERPGPLLAFVVAELAKHASAVRGMHANTGTFNGASAKDREDRAKQEFERRVNEERARYVVESVRGDATGRRTVDFDASARAEEGGGFVVVTILLAWRGLTKLLDECTAPQAVAQLATRVQDVRFAHVMALEVVWVPAEESDVMSSAELVTVFPDIRWTDESARSTLGRIACAHCKTVYAGELGRCPQCGAVPVSPGT